MDRFDNTMDALSIMKEHVPGIADVIDKHIDAINRERDAESIGDKDHIDLSKYGAERAKTAYERRTGHRAPKEEPLKAEPENAEILLT